MCRFSTIPRRIRRDRPKQRLLIADRGQIAQRVTTIGQHDRKIPDHPPRRMRGLAHEQIAELAIKRAREPETIRQPGDQRRPRVRDQTLSVRPDL